MTPWCLESESLRRNVEFYWYAPNGHTNLVFGHGPAQGVGRSRVFAGGKRQIHNQWPRSGKLFSESCVEARRDGAAEVHQPDRTSGREGDRARRRGGRAGRCGAHGIIAGDLAVQSGVAAGAAEERVLDARLPYERAQEVRAEGRAKEIPVHQTVEVTGDQRPA